MERERTIIIEIDKASTATQGALGDPIDDFSGQVMTGLTRD